MFVCVRGGGGLEKRPNTSINALTLGLVAILREPTLQILRAPPPNPQFVLWCEAQLRELSSEVDCETLITFLQEFETEREVLEYVVMMFGDSPEVREFASGFSERRARSAGKNKFKGTSDWQTVSTRRTGGVAGSDLAGMPTLAASVAAAPSGQPPAAAAGASGGAAPAPSSAASGTSSGKSRGGKRKKKFAKADPQLLGFSVAPTNIVNRGGELEKP